VEPVGAAVEEHVDVIVARLPRILEPDGRARLVEGVDLVAQPVEALAQRPAPALVRGAAHAAAAVAAPALDAVGAGPRGALVALHLVGRRLRGQDRRGSTPPRVASQSSAPVGRTRAA